MLGKISDQQVYDQNIILGGYISDNAILSDETTIEAPIHLACYSSTRDGVHIGKYSYFGIGTMIYDDVQIGRFCSVARGVEIGVKSHPTNWLSTHPFQYEKAPFGNCPYYTSIQKQSYSDASGKTFIGNDVWIGTNAIIRSGVTIGDGAIIAAGAFVKDDVTPYSIVGGIPSKVIRKRFDDTIIQRLLDLKWWDLPMMDLMFIDFSNIEHALFKLEQIKLMKGSESQPA